MIRLKNRKSVVFLVAALLLTGCAKSGGAQEAGKTEQGAVKEQTESALQTEQAAQTEPAAAAQMESAAQMTEAEEAVAETTAGAETKSGGRTEKETETEMEPLKETGTFEQISQEEAARIMEEEKDFILLDVRTQEEFESGHIPGAICIPNETIGDGEIKELPDKDQLILVYCRSGRRSREAAEKLAQLGYTKVKDFGGIMTWTGEVVQ